jgi:hypothetical protein
MNIIEQPTAMVVVQRSGGIPPSGARISSGGSRSRDYTSWLG